MNRTSIPEVIGVLNIISGGLSFIGSLFIAIIFSVFLISPYWYWDGTTGFPSAIIWMVFLPYWGISIVAVLGGVFALKRKLWSLVLAGSICSLFTIWASILGIAAIILVIAVKAEFDNTKIIHQNASSNIHPPSISTLP